MAILKTLRQTDTCPPSGLHPYIDTPDFSYDQWLWYLHNNGLPIGSASGSPSVAVIGAGVSGLSAVRPTYSRPAGPTLPRWVRCVFRRPSSFSTST
jgi:hypothetical protein